MATTTYTIEHLGQDATDADLAEFNEMASRLAEHSNIDIDEAADLLWGDGDYFRNYERLMANDAD